MSMVMAKLVKLSQQMTLPADVQEADRELLKPGRPSFVAGSALGAAATIAPVTGLYIYRDLKQLRPPRLSTGSLLVGAGLAADELLARRRAKRLEDELYRGPDGDFIDRDYLPTGLQAGGLSKKQLGGFAAGVGALIGAMDAYGLRRRGLDLPTSTLLKRFGSSAAIGGLAMGIPAAFTAREDSALNARNRMRHRRARGLVHNEDVAPSPIDKIDMRRYRKWA